MSDVMKELETEAVKTMTDSAKVTFDAIKAVTSHWWSFMDAASEKQAASRYLSPDAIKAIQGTKSDGA